MQEDFHYYATYCAAALAGYDHNQCLEICYCAQMVDHCSRTFLKKVGGPAQAATTQLKLELMDARTDHPGLWDITRIWSSFHFLPRDLHADVRKGSKNYKDKYRLICGPNGDLLTDTVTLARGKGTQAAGVAMHVLADTWAHTYFAGTPSLVINNTDAHFFELFEQEDGSFLKKKIVFSHNPSAAEDPEKGVYVGSMYQSSENSIMNLGHGRAGHLPDYSFIRYVYQPAWGEYREILKDNPSDYYRAFSQMVYALKYLRGEHECFEKETYADEAIRPYEERIHEIIRKRQVDASADWKAFGESLGKENIPAFDRETYSEEYMNTDSSKKKETFLGGFLEAALRQKGMITSRIRESGNRLAGFAKVRL